MGLLDRLRNVASGAMSNALGDMERANPEAVYEAAIANGQQRAVELKQATASLAAQRNKLAEEASALEKEQRSLDAALHEALAEDDDEIATVLLARKDELQAALDAVRREHAQVEGAVDETKRGLAQLRADLDALKRERESALAQLAAAQASIDIHDAASGFSTEASARGLESVRSGIGVLDARANEGWRDSEGNSVRGKAEAMGRKAKEAKARAELERLKAAARGEPAAAADDGPHEADDAPESTPSGPPKRTL